MFQGRGDRVDPTQALSLLGHVSETGASYSGRRHSPACLGGWQTPGAGLLPALAGSGDPRQASTPSHSVRPTALSPHYLLLSLWHRKRCVGSLSMYLSVQAIFQTHGHMAFPRSMRCTSPRTDVVTQLPRFFLTYLPDPQVGAHKCIANSEMEGHSGSPERCDDECP